MLANLKGLERCLQKFFVVWEEFIYLQNDC